MTSCSGHFKLRSPEHPLSHHLTMPPSPNGLLCLCAVKYSGKCRQPGDGAYGAARHSETKR